MVKLQEFSFATPLPVRANLTHYEQLQKWAKEHQTNPNVKSLWGEINPENSKAKKEKREFQEKLVKEYLSSLNLSDGRFNLLTHEEKSTLEVLKSKETSFSPEEKIIFLKVFTLSQGRPKNGKPGLEGYLSRFLDRMKYAETYPPLYEQLQKWAKAHQSNPNVKSLWDFIKP